ncbi:response regulator [Stenotrophomonas sp. AB1(2024)]|uniref:response regulator n=1 Tax=Stenotrophomonas sp. AB1(2024) TaxID=3132215 RepID=UPI0030A5E67F
MNFQPLRVFLADDHPIVLIGARAALEQSRTATIIGEARSTDEVIRELSRLPCDVLVTDFTMPGGELDDGIGYLRVVRETHPALPVVVMTMMANPGIMEQILSLGVLGLVDKADDLELLPLAVRSAVVGRLFVSKGLRDLLSIHRTSGGTQDKLSPREMEVVRLLAAGLGVNQIAEKFGKSIKTVSRQKMQAMRKLGLANNVELYQYARENGMII